MNDRQWELYRLSVVKEWQDSPLKEAVLAAIRHRLDLLDTEDAGRQTSVRTPFVRAATA